MTQIFLPDDTRRTTRWVAGRGRSIFGTSFFFGEANASYFFTLYMVFGIINLFLWIFNSVFREKSFPNEWLLLLIYKTRLTSGLTCDQAGFFLVFCEKKKYRFTTLRIPIGQFKFQACQPYASWTVRFFIVWMKTSKKRDSIEKVHWASEY